MKSRLFIFISEFAETFDLAFHLKYHEKQDVVMQITDSKWKKIGDGLVEKCDDWHDYLGQDATFVFDGCCAGKTQDWLRAHGEAVFGGSEKGDELENDRQKGQAWFKKAGFHQPPSQNFKDIDKAVAFVKAHKDTQFILKQNGDASKSLNHIGKFAKNVDMIYHLEQLKKNWNEADNGKFDCDLMEVVDGVEVAAGALWNGHDWMRNADGKVVGWLNWEEKKEADGGLGVTCGEMGTTFLGTSEDNELFKEILIRPEIEKGLKASGFRGVFDINGSLTKEGYVAFEPTMRFGIPSTAYEFIEGMKTASGAVLEAVARGEDTPIALQEGLGMVMVLATKPFPTEADLESEDTSEGEKLWLLDKGEPSMADLWAPKFSQIHPYNLFLDEKTGDLKIATGSGYILTVTGRSDGVKSLRDKIIGYIKDHLYLPSMKWRSDIGERAEKFIEKQA